MILRIENLEGLDRLAARLRNVVNPDATPLMVTWMKIIQDENRRGVLAGLDKDGNPLPAVTYRPIGTPVKHRKRGPGQFLGIGAANNGNLTSSEYRRLDGPPLAPRGVFSRVITNLKTEFDPSARGSGRWEAYGVWDEVVDREGKKFLHYHFHGIGQKRRDLTGVRPDGVRRARAAAVAWIKDIVRSGGV